MFYTNKTYGVGGYDESKPNNNVIGEEIVEVADASDAVLPMIEASAPVPLAEVPQVVADLQQQIAQMKQQIEALLARA